MRIVTVLKTSLGKSTRGKRGHVHVAEPGTCVELPGLMTITITVIALSY